MKLRRVKKMILVNTDYISGKELETITLDKKKSLWYHTLREKEEEFSALTCAQRATYGLI